MIRSGRKSITWANRGIHDIIFGFEYGIPANLEIQRPDLIRAAITNGTPFIGMYGNWSRDGAKDRGTNPPSTGNTISQTAEEFQSTLDIVGHEENLAIYHAASLTEGHMGQLAARAVPEPAPEP